MLDKLIVEFDRGLRTLLASPHSGRKHPDDALAEVTLNEDEKRHVIGLMRVNHCGEVCAQALYSGQSLTSRNPATVKALEHAAHEEIEHLAWCEKRIKELGGTTSALNPIWYGGSFAIGALAGMVGDNWNLGFLAETEKQVGLHLDAHLQKLPEQDVKTRAILEQMRTDEAQHADMAISHGAAELPSPIKAAMQLSSNLMTKTSYYF